MERFIDIPPPPPQYCAYCFSSQSHALLFQYVRCNIPGPDTPRKKFKEQIQGCICFNTKNCIEGCACLRRYGASYSEGKIIGVDPFVNKQNPVFECNKSCNCLPECENRVVQNGVNRKFNVFRTEKKGFGLNILENIPKNTFVCEYAGEILTPETAKERTKDLSSKENGNNYIFVLNEHLLSSGETMSTYVDPMYVGNVGRFINHSCEPNLFMVPVRVNLTIPHLALFALRDIASGEELSFDYSGLTTTSRTEANGTIANVQPIINGDITSSPVEPSTSANGNADLRLKECFCGSSRCRGFLPYDASLYKD